MIRFVFALAAVASFHACAYDALDYSRPINRMADEVGGVLERHDFAKLEKLAQKFRENNVTLSDGQPAVAGFYAGVSKCIELSCGDERLPIENWVRHRALLDEWNAAYPNSATAKLALAIYMKEYAWYARNVGMSDTVSKMQWAIFNARIENSRVLLKAMEAEGKKEPAWYDAMLSIGKMQRWPRDTMDRLYAEGIRAFPDYLPLYFERASYFSPKWGGSLDSFHAFVEDSVAITSRQLGETMYARLNWSEYDPEMFQNGQTNWGRMRAGFERITKDYPDPWNINNYAKFACLAGDVPTLRQQLNRMGGMVIVKAWWRVEYYESCERLAKSWP